MGSNFCRPISSLSPALLQSRNANELSHALENSGAATPAQQIQAAQQVLQGLVQASTRGEEFIINLSLFQSEEWRCLEALLPSLPQTLREQIEQVKQGLLQADQNGNRDGFVNNAETIQWVSRERSQGRTLWNTPTQFRHAAQIITQNLPAALSRVGTRSENPTEVANRVWSFLHSYAAEWQERLQNNPRILNEAGITLENWKNIVTVYGIRLDDFIENNPQNPPALIRRLQHDLENPGSPPQLSATEARALHWVSRIQRVNGEFQLADSPTAPLEPQEFERLISQTVHAQKGNALFYGMRLVNHAQPAWRNFSSARETSCNQASENSETFPACLATVTQQEGEVADLFPFSNIARLAFSNNPAGRIAIRQFMEGNPLEDLTREPRDQLRQIVSPGNLFFMFLLSPPTRIQRLLFNLLLKRECGGRPENVEEAWRSFEQMQRANSRLPQIEILHRAGLGLFASSFLGHLLDKALSLFNIDTNHVFEDVPGQMLSGVLMSQLLNGLMNNSMRHFFNIYGQAFCRETPPLEVPAPDPVPVVERSPAPAQRRVVEYRDPSMVDVAWEGSKSFVREYGYKALGGIAIIAGGALLMDDDAVGSLGMLDNPLALFLMRRGAAWMARGAATGVVLQTARIR